GRRLRRRRFAARRRQHRPALGYARGNAGLYGARAAPRWSRRRTVGPVLVLRGNVAGAVRTTTVRGRRARRATRVDRGGGAAGQPRRGGAAVADRGGSQGARGQSRGP